MRELVALREKYAELHSLRTDGCAPGSARPRVVQLATRFPGALRELDSLPIERIAARIAALDAVIERGQVAAPWMHATARFHALFRSALALKRSQNRAWAAAEEARAPEQRADCNAETGDWACALDLLAAPPGGKLTQAVLMRLAAELGCSVEEARSLVMPAVRGEQAYSLDVDAAGAAGAAAAAAGAAAGAAVASEPAAGLESPAGAPAPAAGAAAGFDDE